VVEGWALRQFLVIQTLLFCALAALVVGAGQAALWGRGYSGRIMGALVAIPLVILLLVSSVERVRSLLTENPDVLVERRRAPPQAREMIDWMAENVPEGEHILVTPAYSVNKYLIFLDSRRHKWTFLRLDQGACEPSPNIQIRCDPDENAISRTPPDAVWVQMVGQCKVISLSMSNLLEQTQRASPFGYVLISGGYRFPGILKLPSRLQESGAFEVVQSELDNDETSGANQNLVLLKSTGRAPRAVPAHMNGNTVLHLRRCEQAKDPGYEERIRSTFPNGISREPD
jgi:hypothetical protein